MQVIPVFFFCLAGARIFTSVWNLAVLFINIKNLDNKKVLLLNLSTFVS